MSMPTNTGQNPTDLDELILLKNKTAIPPFESIILHCHTHRTMMMGYKLHIMTQATYPEDQANLPNGVYVVKTYTELHDGSRNVSVVLRNLMGKTGTFACWEAGGMGCGHKCHPRCYPFPGIPEEIR